ncbi:GntT/GntP/DsdX family permease [Streptomonospora wellingtoniae]|uniref:Uncharacterized protein n=1 Tax=Streptomonospora wellingtoniae TaxID=3075544 RepID=A0ABU2L0U1_9ACTN|nr:hypothetical protein [Streptomonospora sp. DSM 45055]MDT0305177.1 hypothetical protein [Streptomonospora sp. DSM 45055]
MIIMVTGLGGALSELLQATPTVDVIAENTLDLGIPSILLPFILGVLANVITGSTTVGVITASSLTAPMLPALGLSPEAAMLSAASGSVIIKYFNSSYFWVCTTLSGMSLRAALLSYGGVTLVGGAFHGGRGGPLEPGADLSPHGRPGAQRLCSGAARRSGPLATRRCRPGTAPRP